MKKVIDLENVKFVSLNNRYRGKYHLTEEYKVFKELLFVVAKRIKIDPPYSVRIDAKCYHDIDNFIKPILDTLQKVKIIKDDKLVEHLLVNKEPGKRGRPGRLEVYVESLI
jgi:Holliday junction resolvase RusA-like endonuclease